LTASTLALIGGINAGVRGSAFFRAIRAHPRTIAGAIVCLVAVPLMLLMVGASGPMIDIDV
jgi:hypothetical protein